MGSARALWVAWGFWGMNTSREVSPHCHPPRFAPVTCDLGGNAAFEVQLRQKTQHWSSYWSDWSKSIFVPEGEKGPQNPCPLSHGHPGLATRLASFLLQKSWRAQS